MTRSKPRRLAYRQHPQEFVAEFFKATLSEGSVGLDYLENVLTEMVAGRDQFECGVAEGRRRLASEIITMALGDESVEVKTNRREE